jgi:hypothetical protein
VNETNRADAERRHSVALEPDLIKDPLQRAEAEAANGLRQFDAGKNYAQAALDRQEGDGAQFKLRPSIILALHREALAGISTFAGLFRPAGVSIEKSKHVPPGSPPSCRACGGYVRICERPMAIQSSSPLGCVCHVATELDSPFR